ncbi:MAG TPA: LamG-like jellyroll fold domain-containing protein [Candidatus Deferrimicrobiaceae bacterium]|nr:LamG-like jellyroll fold domain-containing protein [Candidatus Deferrimicrobiaceae bacterium]
MASKNIKIKLAIFCLMTASLLSPIVLSTASAQFGGVTVGYWPLDKTQSSDATIVTPDVTGVNFGIVGGHPEPQLVDGKFDKALAFDGENLVYVPIKFIVGFPPTPKPIYVPVSPNLDIQKYVSIQAWINVPSLKDATYNNIVVKADHPDQECDWRNTVRVLGLALRAGAPEVGEEYVQGALSGYVLTESGVNEIVTSQPVPFNQWLHVEFTRTTTGLHLYVDGEEKAVNVLHGSRTPQGNIVNGTELYFGHDSLASIDEVKIQDLEPPVAENAIEIGPNMVIVIIAVSLIFAVAWLLRRAIQLWIIRPKI